MNQGASPDPEQLIRDWQGPVFNLTLRMLRNRADAEDATQDVFERILRKLPTYDRSRPLAPWVFRVARNVVLNRIRATRATEPTREDTVSSSDDHAREAAEAIAEGLQAIPGEQRLLLVLHYYSGLSKTDIASVLSLPRTTVQTRIKGALEKLRVQLARSAAPLVVPALEPALLATRPEPVPTQLAGRLSLLARTAPGTAAGAAFLATTGGIVLSKKALILLALVALLAGTGGYVIGRTTAASDVDLPSVSNHTGSTMQVDGHVGAPPQSPQLAALPATPVDPAGGPADVEAGSGGAEITDETAAALLGATGGEIPWTRMGTLLAGMLEMDEERVRNPGKPAPPGTKARWREFAMAWFSGMELARLGEPHPFFEADVLTGYLDACFTTALGLTAEQAKRLASTARKALDSERDRLELDTASPIEVHAARLRIRERVDLLLDEVVTDKAAPRREKLQEMGFPAVSPALGVETYQLLRVGVEDPEAGARIVALWVKAYGLTETQAADASRNAADLMRLGTDTLGQTPLGQHRRQFAENQVRTENAILRLLSEKQRKSLPSRSLHVIVFRSGDLTEESEEI